MSSSKFDIRAATHNDASEIGDLIRILAQKFIVHEFDAKAAKHFISANDAASVSKNMASGFSYLVALHEDKVVGVLGLKNQSHLYHLFVAEEHQGAGLARLLWQRVLDDTTDNAGIKAFTVNSSNHAVGFYRKLGFSQTQPMTVKDGIQFNPMRYEIDV